MKTTQLPGVFRDGTRLFTKNLEQCTGIAVYNERLLHRNGVEYRAWNPYRSKLAAAVLKGLKNIKVSPGSSVLYLGAATGTTVSHVSDIAAEGMIYAVENSAIAMRKLLQVGTQRPNVIPLLADANHPERYAAMVPTVDFLYQDISQKNQAEIFLINASQYLKDQGQGLFMVKARSIDVSLPPQKAYDVVISQLKDQGMTVVQTVDLAPYEKDHAAIMVTH